MNKMLITGSSGFIGSYIENFFASKKLFNVIGIDIKEEGERKIDVADTREFHGFLKEIKPNIIIHCAAIKNLEKCESDKERSFEVNTLSTETIRDYCLKNNECHVIYISSDVVFDGEKGNYTTSDSAAPVNWYGKTKLFSEIILRNIGKSTILRTALVIGELNKDYRQMLKDEIHNNVLKNQTLLPFYVKERLKLGKSISLPSDIISNPTPVSLIAEGIVKIIRKEVFGLFHLAGSTAISRYDFAKHIALRFGLDDNLIKDNKWMISKIRPKDISLNVEKSYKKIGLKLEKWGIDKYIDLLDLE